MEGLIKYPFAAQFHVIFLLKPNKHVIEGCSKNDYFLAHVCQRI